MSTFQGFKKAWHLCKPWERPLGLRCSSSSLRGGRVPTSIGTNDGHRHVVLQMFLGSTSLMRSNKRQSFKRTQIIYLYTMYISVFLLQKKKIIRIRLFAFSNSNIPFFRCSSSEQRRPCPARSGPQGGHVARRSPGSRDPWSPGPRSPR